MTAPAREGPERRLLVYSDVLDMIIREAALLDVLNHVAEMVEREMPGARASILLVDESQQQVLFGAGPSLPADYNEAIDGALIGPEAGTCGRAAYENRVVVTESIADDPAWTLWRAAADDAGLAACWSVPFAGPRGRVLGCMAAYFGEPRTPERAELDLLRDAGYLAALAVQHNEARQLLRDTSRTHPLTGIANRVVFTERLRAVEAEAAETHGRFAVIQLSIEGMGAINESLGPNVGDAVLRQAAGRLADAVEDSGLAAHMWGCDFAVVVDAVDVDEDAVMFAEKLRDILTEPFDVAGVTLVVGATIGLVSYGADVLDLPQPIDEPLRTANVAMQRAKSSGTRQIGVYDPRADPGADVVLLAPALRRGLDQEEFSLAYQPIVELTNERIDHYEALLRWTTPSGSVPPDSFVPVAERTGLVGDLGRYALEHALAELSALRQAGSGAGVSVNLSVRQLSDESLAELIAELLARYDLPAPCVTMEVTEGVMLSATGRGWDALARVRELGVRIALDDFGTGYSQLPYLRRFDFDEIKIDQSFVATMHTDVRSRALIAGTVAFAEVAGMTVVAEGIERREQADEVRALGCTHGQGFLFGAATRTPSANGRRRPRPGPGTEPGVDHEGE